MDSLWYLVGAFALAWAVVAGYVLLLARRQARIDESLRGLEDLLRD